MTRKNKIILDLCGGTGAWSRHYAEAGYDVRNITLPDYDVRTYEPPDKVYGILAAPPCNCFSRVSARWWENMDKTGQTQEAIEIFRACYRICQLDSAWWALENPPGRQRKLMPELPEPSFQFQPYYYGDPWVKQTYIWGNAVMPFATKKIKPNTTIRCPSGHTQGYIARLPSKSQKRSITPPGFAKAFFEANP